MAAEQCHRQGGEKGSTLTAWNGTHLPLAPRPSGRYRRGEGAVGHCGPGGEIEQRAKSGKGTAHKRSLGPSCSREVHERMPRPRVLHQRPERVQLVEHDIPQRLHPAGIIRQQQQIGGVRVCLPHPHPDRHPRLGRQSIPGDHPLPVRHRSGPSLRGRVISRNGLQGESRYPERRHTPCPHRHLHPLSAPHAAAAAVAAGR